MKVFRQLAALFRRRKIEADMAEEMRLHLEHRTQENLAAGMAADEAHYAALRQFGGVEQAKELVRDQRGWLWLEQAAQDFRYAAGSLRRNPIFSVTAVLTLVLGLGATTTIFTLVDAVVWRPLPYAQPQRLVESYQFTGQTLRDWSEAQHVVERIETHQQRGMVLSSDAGAEQISAEAVSPGLFDLLGRRPTLGRAFEATDAEEGSQLVVLLSDNFWRQRFGGDPQVVGRTITLDERPHTVIGVMPRGFAFRGANAVLWVPLTRPTSESALRRRVEVTARLRPGLEIAAVQAEVKALNSRLDQSHPQSRAWDVNLTLLDRTRVNPAPRRMMLLTVGAVTCVLLIACANVANLLLVRAITRQREFAVRAALGAGGGRLIRQVLTESLMLVVLGAAGGMLVAQWAVQAIWRLAPNDLTFLVITDVRVDWRIAGFTLLLVGLAAIVCGAVPALRVARVDANQTLNSGTRTSTATRRQRRWQHGFVITQTALAFVLLVGAGLLMRGLLRLSAVSPGFDASNLAALTLSLPGKRYPSPAERQDFFQRLRERVAALPGVTATTVATGVPPSGGGFSFSPDVEVEGREPQKLGATEFLPYNTVGDDYFRVVGIPLVRGRAFDLRDVPGGPPVIIINDRMAHRFWPDSDPIGQRVRFDARQPWLTIVGIAADVKAMTLNDENGSLEYYRSMRQEGTGGYTTLVIRTERDPQQLGPAVRRQVAALDPQLPTGNFLPVEALWAATLAVPRFCLALMTGFAGIAIVLALIGLYGVMSYTVSQRVQEIGVRIALGGSSGEIIGLIARRGLALTGTGLACGALAAVGLTRFLQTMLFEISPLDPATFSAVAAILAVMGMFACWVPARRAAKVDPIVALRCE